MLLRLLILFVVGACLGGAINLAIYRLAYWRRRISPWSRTWGQLPARTWRDRIPIHGWWRLRRESKFHGEGFWIRPLLIELFCALGLAGLYWWERVAFAINVSPAAPNFVPREPQVVEMVGWQFVIHVVLLALLVVATFIDIDEQTIPDTVTIPGTIAALAIAAACAAPVLPSLWIDFDQPSQLDLVAPLQFDFPGHAAAFLHSWTSLAAGAACYLGWCFGLLPRRWRRGVGPIRAARAMYRRIFARPEWKWIVPLAVAGGGAITLTWFRGGGSWHRLLSALIGMAVGGGMVWIVRITSGAVLKREAMGFGDVTLMAMIGAFFGWQAAIVVFFLAPLAGAVVGGIQWILARNNVIPFGPFLCLAALVLLLFWAPLWHSVGIYFEIPWLVPSAIALCLPLMALLLYFWQLIKAGTAGR